ncbi:MAG TPA: hypothetical protein VFY16_06140 [Gemmatimonadaceae bacterium]|nr:hypothetical protein [Gemmatimonadaceae bacterium]
MADSVPSPFAWPVLAGMAGIFLPLAVALIARRSVRVDPVAHVALGWAVLGALDVASLVLYVRYGPEVVRPATFAPFVALILFIPPLFHWLGPAVRRIRWPALAFAVVLSSSGVALLGVERALRAVASPVARAVLAALSVAALARCCWRSARVPWRMDWFWVLLGMIVFYGVGIIWAPLTEYLVSRSWAAVVDLHMGMMLVHLGAYLLIARGAALRPGAQAEPPRWTTAASEVV